VAVKFLSAILYFDGFKFLVSHLTIHAM